MLSLLALALPVPTFADGLDEVCKQQLCRAPFSLTLQKQDGTQFNNTFDRALPIITGRWITLFPGETLYIEADPTDPELKNFRAVEKNVHPDKTLVFRFEQMEGKADMMLKVHNPFDRNLKYHVVMMTPDSDRLLKTSSCPVMPKKDVFESWPHAIFQLLFFEFKLLAEDAEKKCEF